ncbi:Crp/Fnr family transcriptional regulator [Longitalea luteola]|uniref:Crp/Fnr family transcriptional regulator n=1 Tax=Longitalea luteola TaxID=2812563 RepID=UPI001A96336E|nr:Crp/Fnr family transcriptional regulator [Longitalea luteola]
MQPTPSIENYVRKYVDLNDEELAHFASAFKEVKVKKRQFLIQPNFVARHRYFVLKGAVRAYVVAEDDQDNTIQLAIEEWWISDYNSYMFQQPASMFVMAVEDSTLLQISFEDEQRLKASNYKYETFFRMIAERAAAFMQRRVITSLTMSAEQRYDLLIEKYPEMANRFPQYVIASYLGMTTEFLSRIRKQKLRSKG